MILKKWAYYFSKFTLIDEILGFIYWALVIYGVFLIVERIENQVAIIAALFIYIVTAAILYIFVIKKMKIYFKGGQK
jgi:hypothetical protein